jgi:hypothetical protein
MVPASLRTVRGGPLTVVIDRLTERPEVAGVNTSVVNEHIRRPVLEPLDVSS